MDGTKVGKSLRSWSGDPARPHKPTLRAARRTLGLLAILCAQACGLAALQDGHRGAYLLSSESSWDNTRKLVIRTFERYFQLLRNKSVADLKKGFPGFDILVEKASLANGIVFLEAKDSCSQNPVKLRAESLWNPELDPNEWSSVQLSVYEIQMSFDSEFAIRGACYGGNDDVKSSDPVEVSEWVKASYPGSTITRVVVRYPGFGAGSARSGYVHVDMAANLPSGESIQLRFREDNNGLLRSH